MISHKTAKAGFPEILTTRYVIEDGEVSARDILRGTTQRLTLTADTTNATVSRTGSRKASIAQRLFGGIGDVVISTPSETETYKSAFFAEEFRRAVEHEVNRLKKSAKDVIDRESLTHRELENFAVQIPPPGRALQKLMIGAVRFTTYTGEAKVVANDWVKTGDTLAISPAKILAPFDGKIQSTALTEVDAWSAEENWPIPYNAANDFGVYLGATTLCTIIPVTGSDVSQAVPQAYAEFIREARNEMDKARSLSQNKAMDKYRISSPEQLADFFNRAEQQIQMLASAKTRVNRAGTVNMADVETLEEAKVRVYTPGGMD